MIKERIPITCPGTTHTRKGGFPLYGSRVGGILLLGIVATAVAVEDIPGADPIGPATVPQSLFQDGLLPTPNPVDVSYNLVMTGNVDGGKHFRGYMPYRSVSDLSIDVGSAYLDTFMRYTQVPADSDLTVPGYSPFYSYASGVTGMVPGQGYVTVPGMSMMGMVPELRQMGPSNRTLITMDDISLWGDTAETIDLKGLPLIKEDSPKDAREIIARDFPVQGLEVPEADGSAEPWTELDPMDKEGVEASEDLSLLKKPGGQEAMDPGTRSRAVEIQTSPEEDIDDGNVVTRDDLDLLDHISDPALSPGEDIDRWQEDEQDVNEDGGGSNNTMMDLWRNITVRPGDKDTSPGPSTQDVAWNSPIPPSVQEEMLSLRMKGSSQDLDQASFATYSQRQFCRYINEAEHHLRCGDSRRALDAYTMADVYYGGDPLVDLGKSHALFAQGEFAGSALFLNRALEGLPAYGKVRLDLAGLLGGEQRLAEYIKQAEIQLTKTSSVDLHIVLGYIYYQIGDLDSARAAIEAAGEIRPDCPAVKVMAEVIQQAYDALR